MIVGEDKELQRAVDAAIYPSPVDPRRDLRITREPHSKILELYLVERDPAETDIALPRLSRDLMTCSSQQTLDRISQRTSHCLPHRIIET